MGIVDRKDQGFLAALRIEITGNLFQNFAGIIRQNNLAVELRNIEIHFVFQSRTIQEFIRVGIVFGNMLALFELRLVYDEVCVDDIRRIVVHQPAVNNRFPIAVGINRLPEDLCRMERGSCSQRNLDSIKILDDLLVFAHVVILAVIEDLFFRHLAVKDLASVRFIHDDQVESAGHEIRLFGKDRPL